ncbi:MAG: glycosyltransferase family 2 protein [Gammaproteobacteria bacterium]
MIVKNEARIIQRCLDSVLPLIDYALIVDTGSNDGTQELVRRYLCEKRLPGEVIEEAWQNFAYNRNVALRKLRERSDIDYGLMIDADEILVFEAGFDAERFKRDLHCSLYDVQTRYAGSVYSRPQLFSNRLEFHFKAVLHEYLDCACIPSREPACGFYNLPNQDGARSRNPSKFRDDAALLENALRTETDPFLISRYTFYLAQSYRDSGDKVQALQAYLRRSQQGHWQQEIFVSLYNAARIQEELGHADADIMQAYLDAYESCPTRAEALHGATRFCRLRNKFNQGYILAKYALEIPPSIDGLFVEQWIYDYGLLDELSLAAYWTGRYRECFDACLTLLENRVLPQDYRTRIRQNVEFALEKLNDPTLRKLLP